MNDFTKEELVFIKDGLSFILNVCSLEDEFKVKMAKSKIQCMVDNRCDHDAENVYGSVMMKCEKCENVYWSKPK